MNLYGPTPTARDLKHNEEARHYPTPPYDGEINGRGYWNCTRNNVTFKVGQSDYDNYGQYFSIIHSAENQMVEHAKKNYIPEGTAVCDIGAQVGSFTLPFLVAGHPVYTFEVDPHSFHDLMNHIRLNSDLINPEHINCYNFGLYSENITGDYYNMKNVKFRRLDDVLPDVNNCSFFKVDVEGAELNVLQGSVEFLKRNQPTMWIECHECFNPGINQKVLEYVKTIGFQGFTVKEYEIVVGTKHFLIAKD